MLAGAAPATAATTATAPGAPGVQQIGALSCAIVVRDQKNAVVGNGSAKDSINFPLEVEMRVTSIGGTDLTGIANRFAIHHRQRSTPPMPSVTETTNLAAGEAAVRTFTVEADMVEFEPLGSPEQDRLRITVIADSGGAVASSNPAAAALRTCRHSIDLYDSPK